MYKSVILVKTFHRYQKSASKIASSIINKAADRHAEGPFVRRRGVKIDGPDGKPGNRRWPTREYYAKWETDARLPRARCSYFLFAAARRAVVPYLLQPWSVTKNEHKKKRKGLHKTRLADLSRLRFLWPFCHENSPRELENLEGCGISASRDVNNAILADSLETLVPFYFSHNSLRIMCQHYQTLFQLNSQISLRHFRRLKIIRMLMKW